MSCRKLTHQMMPQKRLQYKKKKKSHRIRTPLQMSISCIFRLMQFGTFSVKVTVGGQTGIALIDTGSSSTFIDLYLAVTTTCHIQKKKSAKIAVAGGGQLTSGAIIADTAFCFLVFQRSGGAEEFLVEKGRALANPSIPTLEKKKPILRHLLPSVHIII